MAKQDVIREYLATIGAKGGAARVPKGTSALTAEQRKEQGRKGALKRWGSPRRSEIAKKAAAARWPEGKKATAKPAKRKKAS